MIRNGGLLTFMSTSITFEIIFSKTVLKWLVIMAGYKIKGIDELEARKSKNSFI